MMPTVNLRVLVCGGRDFANYKAVRAVLNQYAKNADVIIHGGATGADALAQTWADAHGFCCKVYRADWRRNGRAAGPLRNARMIANESPDLVIAFPGGRGTADMVQKAKAAGIAVVEITP